MRSAEAEGRQRWVAGRWEIREEEKEAVAGAEEAGLHLKYDLQEIGVDNGEGGLALRD